MDLIIVHLESRAQSVFIAFPIASTSSYQTQSLWFISGALPQYRPKQVLLMTSEQRVLQKPPMYWTTWSMSSTVFKRPIEPSSKVHGPEFLDGSNSSHSKKQSSSKPTLASSAISSGSLVFQAHVGFESRLYFTWWQESAIWHLQSLWPSQAQMWYSDSDIEIANKVLYVNSTVCHSPISLWRTYSDIFPAQSESSSIASRGFFLSGLPWSEQLVGWRWGPRIHNEAGTSTNTYSGKQWELENLRRQ